jgi:hypothetical protein
MCAVGEECAGQMPAAAVAARAVVEALGVRLDEAHEIGDRVGLHRRTDDEDVGHVADLGDRHRVAQRLEGHLGVEMRIDRVGRKRPHDDRVPVGRRFRDEIDADIAARPGAVFHDDRLAEQRRHPVGDGSCRHVERAARRKRHDEADRTAGESLRARDARQGSGRTGCGDEKAAGKRQGEGLLGVGGAAFAVA